MANISLSQYSRDCVRRFLSTTEGHPSLQLHRMILSEVEKPLLEEVLQHCAFNLTHAAELLGLSRATLRKKLDDYRIKH